MKKTIILFIGVCLICLGILNENKKENNELYNADVINKEKNTLSMMLETSAGSGEYQQTTASAWPGDGYVFNTTLSKCKNGSNLSWDNDKKQVIFDGNIKDDCYIYFDKGIILSEYIKSLYTVQGSNNLYLHDSTLENGAGDNSYRFSGSSDTTNNFVCFGYNSTDGTCPTDYLYRIIGVFENQVKLIKYDYVLPSLLGTDGAYINTYSNNGWPGTNKGVNLTKNIGIYFWNNATVNNNWIESNFNKINLNANFLNNIGNPWVTKISLHKWIAGGNTEDKVRRYWASTVYQNEIINPSRNISYEAKIGLVYLSDYGFAAASSAWTTYLSSYSQVTSINWMHMGLHEWTITPKTDVSNAAYDIDQGGDSFCATVIDAFAIRPCFYLNSDVLYISGNGTKTEPFLIK